MHEPLVHGCLTRAILQVTHTLTTDYWTAMKKCNATSHTLFGACVRNAQRRAPVGLTAWALSCTAKAYVPTPCGAAVATHTAGQQRVICNCRDAAQVLFGPGASAPDRRRAVPASATSWAAPRQKLLSFRIEISSSMGEELPENTRIRTLGAICGRPGQPGAFGQLLCVTT